MCAVPAYCDVSCGSVENARRVTIKMVLDARGGHPFVTGSVRLGAMAFARPSKNLQPMVDSTGRDRVQPNDHWHFGSTSDLPQLYGWLLIEFRQTGLSRVRGS